ncbi:MAG TPA: hypothetical protein VMS76_05775 [Planctomycetota bacterium]|nr:hypothetical protein [Planctomycetota bacterium]
MKHIVFLVHGMGRHAPQAWAESVVAKLEESAQRYPFFQGRSLAQWAEFVPIDYDERITGVLRTWQDSAGPVSAFAAAQDLDFAGGLDWLDGIAAEDADFYWTHIADVVIYRLFRLYRERIRISVVDQIATVLAREFDQHGGATASVIAHSLGTAVTHDALCKLGGAPPANLPNTLAHPHWAFKHIFMLANTSRVLQSDFKAYTSIVRPGPANSAQAYCSRFHSFHHELDPFTIPRRFAPSNWSTLYRGEELGHFREWNVHGFGHYLDNPRCHVPILRAITRSDAITAAEAGRAVDEAAYPRFGGQFQPLVEARAKLAELSALRHELADDPSLPEALGIVSRGFKLLREIRDVLP